MWVSFEVDKIDQPEYKPSAKDPAKQAEQIATYARAKEVTGTNLAREYADKIQNGEPINSEALARDLMSNPTFFKEFMRQQFFSSTPEKMTAFNALGQKAQDAIANFDEAFGKIRQEVYNRRKHEMLINAQLNTDLLPNGITPEGIDIGPAHSGFRLIDHGKWFSPEGDIMFTYPIIMKNTPTKQVGNVEVMVSPDMSIKNSRFQMPGTGVV